VLLHGGGANLESMDQYAVRLGDARRTVAVDAHACGQPGDPEHFRLVDVADDVDEVATLLGLGRVDVVGPLAGWVRRRLPRVGYTAPNVRRMAARNFVEREDGLKPAHRLA